jgi:hypothetical protein
MKITIDYSSETLDQLESRLAETHRTLKNFIEALVVAAAYTEGSYLDLDRVGKIVKITKSK